MTKNFSILEDYNVFKHQKYIIERIEKIENLIKHKKDLDYAYLEGGKILEKILSDNYKKMVTLDGMIKDFIAKRITPTKVRSALYSVKSKRNDGSHIVKQSNIPYHVKADLFAVVEFLKQLFIIIKFFVREHDNKNFWTDSDNQEYTFNSFIYLPSMDIKATQEIDKVVDVANDTDYLKSKLIGVFELISSDFYFLIPTYQRDYTWSKDNIDVFLQDIKDRAKDKMTHYMGSLAVGVDPKIKILRLIDGQQRITTSLLLLKAIIDNFSKFKSFQTPKELEFIKSKLSSKYSNSSTYGSFPHIKNILNNNFPSLDKDFQKSIAYENFNYIKKYLDEMNYQEFDEFYTSFFSNFVVSVITFSHNLDQEIQIFENLNSKGTVLSQWDLIKNYIYQKVSIECLIQNEHNIDAMLNKLFIFKASQYFGNKKKYNELSKFFVFYCRIASKLNKSEVLSDKGKIHKVFASLWPQTSTIFDNVEDLRVSLLEVARLFAIYCILVSKDYLKNTSKLFAFKLHLENSSIKEAHFPLIINAIKECVEWDDIEINKISDINKAKLLNLIGDIDKYITRLIVVNNAAQSLSYLFDSCISRDIEKSHRKFKSSILEKGKQISLPLHKDFARIIRTKSDWQVSYAMAVLRSISWNNHDSNDEKHSISTKYFLEHLFPPVPKDDSLWFQESGLTWSNFKEKTYRKTNKLGNYLLVSSNKILKAKNKSFIEKLEIYQPFTDENLLSGNFGQQQIMNLLSKKTFTLEDIDHRTKELASILAPLYKLSFEK